MTSTSRPRIPPALLISWIARAVPKKCSDSETAINPVRENSTPTRQTSRSDCFAGRSALVIGPSPASSSKESGMPAQPSSTIKRLVRVLATPWQLLGDFLDDVGPVFCGSKFQKKARVARGQRTEQMLVSEPGLAVPAWGSREQPAPSSTRAAGPTRSHRATFLTRPRLEIAHRL